MCSQKSYNLENVSSSFRHFVIDISYNKHTFTTFTQIRKFHHHKYRHRFFINISPNLSHSSHHHNRKTFLFIIIISPFLFSSSSSSCFCLNTHYLSFIISLIPSKTRLPIPVSCKKPTNQFVLHIV